ncbi:hypothetical protein ACFXAE_09965 [Streptomyces sp. NPDC059454]|uniref:hypothetical protein n=1 Tax=Streptomyces sp. NPDC059454 TaxID=3346836 RepID=UPI003692CB39
MRHVRVAVRVAVRRGRPVEAAAEAVERTGTGRSEGRSGRVGVVPSAMSLSAGSTSGWDTPSEPLRGGSVRRPLRT